MFENVFEKCLIQSDKFSNVYIKSIMEYVQYFGYNSDGFSKFLECIIENIQGLSDLNHMTYFFHQAASKRLKPTQK